jgi:hypothetical protein
VYPRHSGHCGAEENLSISAKNLPRTLKSIKMSVFSLLSLFRKNKSRLL